MIIKYKLRKSAETAISAGKVYEKEKICINKFNARKNVWRNNTAVVNAHCCNKSCLFGWN